MSASATSANAGLNVEWRTSIPFQEPPPPPGLLSRTGRRVHLVKEEWRPNCARHCYILGYHPLLSSTVKP